ncbi:guanine nucleotide-binding G(I) G(S) G(O) subunit gamma-12-like protein [Labeo rohita]|uniref:Guanine nucleotide-binding protein subunit gamma n=1 Tax=Labeo rohita TaxID=84645 RepID=A0A498M1V6_LABRO|nr:guanine nucleotide-binding G(I) G(S) G(O) subunit gamma-12-like protein [Labeo rohita]
MAGAAWSWLRSSSQQAVPEREGGTGPSAEVWVAQWAAQSAAILLCAPSCNYSRDIKMSCPAQFSAPRVSSLLSGQLDWPASCVHSPFKPAVNLLDDSKERREWVNETDVGSWKARWVLVLAVNHIVILTLYPHMNLCFTGVSKASADLMHYCSEHAKYDPLLMGIPTSENPFKDKKPCTIL